MYKTQPTLLLFVPHYPCKVKQDDVLDPGFKLSMQKICVIFSTYMGSPNSVLLIFQETFWVLLMMFIIWFFNLRPAQTRTVWSEKLFQRPVQLLILPGLDWWSMHGVGKNFLCHTRWYFHPMVVSHLAFCIFLLRE